MAVAVLKYVFHKDAGAAAHCRHAHYHWLGVCRKAGIWHGADMFYRHKPAGGHDIQASAHLPHLAARFLKGGKHGQDVGVIHVPQGNAPSRHCCRSHVGGGNNAVGHHPVLAAEKLLHPVNDDAALPRPVNAPAAAVEIGGEIRDFRLPGSVCDNGSTLGAHRCQHQVFRGSHAGEGKGHIGPLDPPRRPTLKAPAPFLNLHPQLLQGGDMQVNGPRPQFAAAGEAEPGLPAPGDNGTQKHNGRSHFPHKLLGHLAAGHGVVHNQIRAFPGAAAPQVLQNAYSRFHVRQVGAVVQHALALAQNRCRQNRQRAVLGPLDADFPAEFRGAVNNNHREHLDLLAYAII